MPDHLPKVLAWLQTQYLECHRKRKVVAVYSTSGRREPTPADSVVAAIHMASFHQFLLSIGAEVVQTIDACAEAGWIARLDRIAPGGRLERCYEVLPSVLTAKIHSPASQGAEAKLRPLNEAMKSALKYIKKHGPVTASQIAPVAGVTEGRIRTWCSKKGHLYPYGIRNPNNKDGYVYDKSADLSRSQT